jgi:predicted nucleotidyltransferase
MVTNLAAIVSDWAANEPLVRRVYLFGSRARKTARPESDIDLAILHNTDSRVLGTCDPSLAHWMTWEDHCDRWRTDIQALLKLPVDVQQIDRESRKIVIPALKQCRICLYRRGLLEGCVAL